jgi:beta-phosphoglucomutase-like phosphatase (HAD superfamily)
MKVIGTPAITCVVDIVKKYHKKLPMAVASSGNREHVLHSLRMNGLEEYFDAIITCEDVSNPKPAPDIFLLAAKRINCDPSKCRGFEDGDIGILALQRAGMEVIDVRKFESYPNPSLIGKTFEQKSNNENALEENEEDEDEDLTFIEWIKRFLINWLPIIVIIYCLWKVVCKNVIISLITI